MRTGIVRAVALALAAVCVLAWLWLGAATGACSSGLGQFEQALSARAASACREYGSLRAAAGWGILMALAMLGWTFLPRRVPGGAKGKEEARER